MLFGRYILAETMKAPEIPIQPGILGAFCVLQRFPADFTGSWAVSGSEPSNRGSILPFPKEIYAAFSNVLPRESETSGNRLERSANSPNRAVVFFDPIRYNIHRMNPHTFGRKIQKRDFL